MNLQDTLQWSMKWFVNFNAGKTHLYYQSNNSGGIVPEMYVSVLDKKL